MYLPELATTVNTVEHVTGKDQIFPSKNGGDQSCVKNQQLSLHNTDIINSLNRKNLQQTVLYIIIIMLTHSMKTTSTVHGLGDIYSKL